MRIKACTIFAIHDPMCSSIVTSWLDVFSIDMCITLFLNTINDYPRIKKVKSFRFQITPDDTTIQTFSFILNINEPSLNKNPE